MISQLFCQYSLTFSFSKDIDLFTEPLRNQFLNIFLRFCYLFLFIPNFLFFCYLLHLHFPFLFLVFSSFFLFSALSLLTFSPFLLFSLLFSIFATLTFSAYHTLLGISSSSLLLSSSQFRIVVSKPQHSQNHTSFLSPNYINLHS